MHFEVLVEDQSGGIAIEFVLAKILGPNGTRHSWRVRKYKGLGRIPRNLRANVDPTRRLLLARLPHGCCAATERVSIPRTLAWSWWSTRTAATA